VNDPAPAHDEPLTIGYPGSRPAPYGSGPYATPPASPSSASTDSRRLIERADIWTAILGTVAVVPLGVPAALLWVWLAPRALMIKAPDGVFPVVPETRAFVGADMTFLFIALGAGLLCAAVGAILARHRGVAVAVAMTIGGFGASWIAAWLGRWISGGPSGRWSHHASVGTHHSFIALQTQPFVVAWPLIAVLATFVVALCTLDTRPTTTAAAESPANATPSDASTT